jgi:hypothetical protein
MELTIVRLAREPPAPEANGGFRAGVWLLKMTGDNRPADRVLPLDSCSYAVFDPRLLDGIDNLPTTVTTFPSAFQRDIAVA